MTSKPSKKNRIKGDVNITDGDFIAGDKIVTYGEEHLSVQTEKASRKTTKSTDRVQERDLDDSMDISGGDVVFGDKVIKFFQENLKIYLFKDIWQLLAFLVFIVLVAGGVGGATWYFNRPEVMDKKSYNIAVAKFGEYKDGSYKASTISEKISDDLVNHLQNEFEQVSLGPTKVRISHKNMPLITDLQDARELAELVNANIVIFGDVQSLGNQARFTPRFFIWERTDADELTGDNKLDAPILFNVEELESQMQMEEALKTRSEILVNFTKALVFKSFNDRESALQAIDLSRRAWEKLISQRESQNPSSLAEDSSLGGEVIYLLAAVLQAENKDYDAANKLLDLALEIDPGYARAYLAQGNILYAQAADLDQEVNDLDKRVSELKGEAAESDNDPALLEQAAGLAQESQLKAAREHALFEQALEKYQLASTMTDQPASAHIPIKSKISMANALIVLAQENEKDPEKLRQAEKYFIEVRDLYERTPDPDRLFRIYAFNTYFGLGAVYQIQGQNAQAVQNYQKALALTDDPSMKTSLENTISTLQSK